MAFRQGIVSTKTMIHNLSLSADEISLNTLHWVLYNSCRKLGVVVFVVNLTHRFHHRWRQILVRAQQWVPTQLEDTGHVTIEHRLMNQLFSLYSLILCPFVSHWFTSPVSSTSRKRPKVAHDACSVSLIFLQQYVTSYVIYYWTDEQQHQIYLFYIIKTYIVKEQKVLSVLQ